MHLNSLNIMENFVRERLPDRELKILDLGSRIVAGQQKLGSYRQYFTNPKWHYTGADTAAGDNVDVVVGEYSFPFNDGEFDVIISGQTIEHVEFPWVWMQEMVRVLKPGGICCIIAPSVLHEHKYPIDTFRYYPDGMRSLAKWSGLEVLKVKRVRVDAGMEDTFMIAQKPIKATTPEKKPKKAEKISDLTVLYLTASKIPQHFAVFQRQKLLEAIGDTDLVSISREPLPNFGKNILDEGERCTDNIYRQMLRGAKAAKTEFVAIAEDDTLYPRDHFTIFRPAKDTFAYNHNRFALFTWGEPTYSWRNRKSNATLLAPRQLMIDALEERFKKHPGRIEDGLCGELGRSLVDKRLGVTVRKSQEYYSEYSVVQVNHVTGSDVTQVGRRKKMGPVKTFDLPVWGKAADVVKEYR